MNMQQSILLSNAVATLFMVGLIWMVQVVHYPLFNDIGEQNYIAYQQRHQNNITWIVGPVMLIELLTTVLLAFYPTEGISKSLIYLGIGLVVVIWLSTAFLQVPCHNKLSRGFDPSAYKWLVQSNWLRTIAWTARGAIVTYLLAQVLKS